MLNKTKHLQIAVCCVFLCCFSMSLSAAAQKNQQQAGEYVVVNGVKYFVPESELQPKVSRLYFTQTFNELITRQNKRPPQTLDGYKKQNKNSFEFISKLYWARTMEKLQGVVMHPDLEEVTGCYRKWYQNLFKICFNLEIPVFELDEAIRKDDANLYMTGCQHFDMQVNAILAQTKTKAVPIPANELRVIKMQNRERRQYEYISRMQQAERSNYPQQGRTKKN